MKSRQPIELPKLEEGEVVSIASGTLDFDERRTKPCHVFLMERRCLAQRARKTGWRKLSRRVNTCLYFGWNGNRRGSGASH